MADSSFKLYLQTKYVFYETCTSNKHLKTLWFLYYSKLFFIPYRSLLVILVKWMTCFITRGKFLYRLFLWKIGEQFKTHFMYVIQNYRFLEKLRRVYFNRYISKSTKWIIFKCCIIVMMNKTLLYLYILTKITEIVYVVFIQNGIFKYQIYLNS